MATRRLRVAVAGMTSDHVWAMGDGLAAQPEVEMVAGASEGQAVMTLMIIFGAAAALYCLVLLFRCATFALPLFVGLGVALRLYGTGHGGLLAVLAGLGAAIAILEFGRLIARSSTLLWLRLPVILIFASAAATAGYQAGAALVLLSGFNSTWQHVLAILAGLVTGCRSWRDLGGPALDTDIPISQS